MSREMIPPTVPCETCGDATPFIERKRCNGCHEVETRLSRYLQSAKGQAFVQMALDKAMREAEEAHYKSLEVPGRTRLQNILAEDLFHPMNRHHAGIKDEFHALGRGLLTATAKAMGLAKGRFEVSSNKGGTAVLGEVSLKAAGFYLSLGGRVDAPGFYRTATKEDPYGTKPEHHNRPLLIEYIATPDALAKVLLALVRDK